MGWLDQNVLQLARGELGFSLGDEDAGQTDLGQGIGRCEFFQSRLGSRQIALAIKLPSAEAGQGWIVGRDLAGIFADPLGSARFGGGQEGELDAGGIGVGRGTFGLFTRLDHIGKLPANFRNELIGGGLGRGLTGGGPIDLRLREELGNQQGLERGIGNLPRATAFWKASGWPAMACSRASSRYISPPTGCRIKDGLFGGGGKQIGGAVVDCARLAQAHRLQPGVGLIRIGHQQRLPGPACEERGHSRSGFPRRQVGPWPAGLRRSGH